MAALTETLSRCKALIVRLLLEKSKWEGGLSFGHALSLLSPKEIRAAAEEHRRMVGTPSPLFMAALHRNRKGGIFTLTREEQLGLSEAEIALLIRRCNFRGKR